MSGAKANRRYWVAVHSDGWKKCHLVWFDHDTEECTIECNGIPMETADLKVYLSPSRPPQDLLCKRCLELP